MAMQLQWQHHHHHLHCTPRAPAPVCTPGPVCGDEVRAALAHPGLHAAHDPHAALQGPHRTGGGARARALCLPTLPPLHGGRAWRALTAAPWFTRVEERSRGTMSCDGAGWGSMVVPSPLSASGPSKGSGRAARPAPACSMQWHMAIRSTPTCCPPPSPRLLAPPPPTQAHNGSGKTTCFVLSMLSRCVRAWGTSEIT